MLSIFWAIANGLVATWKAVTLFLNFKQVRDIAKKSKAAKHRGADPYIIKHLHSEAINELENANFKFLWTSPISMTITMFCVIMGWLAPWVLILEAAIFVGFEIIQFCLIKRASSQLAISIA